MIGLTGGIGSGKSVVAARLAELGAVVIDSDRIAREVVAPGTEGLREVIDAFGPRVHRDDGSLDRAALGEIVFGDAAARSRLEEIIHPRVRARTAHLTAEAAPDAIVVNDVPLLVEVGLAPTYHLVVVVRAEAATRIGRLVRDRGMTPEQAEQRIRAQAGDERRNAAADVLLDNDGELAELHAAVDALWHDRLVPFERNVRARRPVRADAPRPVGAEPDWSARFARLTERIRYAARPVAVRVEHVGALALPGPAASEVVEVGVSVAASDVDALADRLTEAGFPPRPAERRADPGGPGERRADPGGPAWGAGPGGPAWGAGAGRRGDAGGGTERLHGSADPGRPVNLRVRVVGASG